MAANAREPWPLEPGESESALARLARGATWREAFEGLLLALPPVRAELLMQLSREGRGAFLPLLAARGAGARALVVGNALSGTAIALGRAGYALVVVDPERERVTLGRARQDLLVPGGRHVFITADGAPHLPFAPGAFDLVVQEAGMRPRGFGHDLDELARVAGDELVLVADNRFAYKRSSGIRADFRVPGPIAWIAAAVRPRAGERSLVGYRAKLQRRIGACEAFALYPHRSDFSHVVALDEPLPRLWIGPKERKNVFKLAANRAGLFPWLAPSYALHARRDGVRGARLLDTWLERIADATGERLPRVEHVVATRGNTAVLLTSRAGADPRDPEGRWCLHVALSPQQEVQARRHIDRLRELASAHPRVPVPAPLLAEEIGGIHVTAERRLAGFNAAQSRVDECRAARTLADVDEQLGSLVHTRVRIDRAAFERLVAPKFQLVADHAGRAETARAIHALLADVERRLDGVEIPLVLQHADLRGKHLHVDEAGRVLGYLDWGSSEDEDLPLFDLVNLIVHDKKQRAGTDTAVAWHAVRDGRMEPHEARAIASHTERLALPRAYVDALLAMYPVLVGAMAEKNWDYSRPRWVHKNFGV